MGQTWPDQIHGIGRVDDVENTGEFRREWNRCFKMCVSVLEAAGGVKVERKEPGLEDLKKQLLGLRQNLGLTIEREDAMLERLKEKVKEITWLNLALSNSQNIDEAHQINIKIWHKAAEIIRDILMSVEYSHKEFRPKEV